jgi:YebC/PmpR family DNA-binding regulatory protein
MAGHSHSSNIKFRKDRVDAKRARLFAKLARMIAVAAKAGGGNPDANPRLRLAIDKARVVSMPNNGIERAIKKATGEGDGGSYEEAIYEGYGPGGVAVMLEILTDNRNRTAPEIRRIFERFGGSLSASGSVAWMFERKGLFAIDPGQGLDEARLMDITLEVGGEDLQRAGDGFVIHCAPSAFSDVRAALERRGVALTGGEIGYVPTNRTAVADVDVARKIVGLLEGLDEHDDVQGVHSNEDFAEAVSEALG